MLSILCKIGLHKYRVVKGTEHYVDKYTEGAELVCERCLNTAYGERLV